MLESLLNEDAALQVWNFIEKILQKRLFLVSFSKILRTPFLQDTSGWLPLFFGN